MAVVPRLTRRRTFEIAGAAGLASLLARAAPPAWARRRSRPRSFVLDVGRESFGDDRRTAVLRAPRRFDLLGVRGGDVARAGLEVRVRPRAGGWSPWVPLHAGADHRPDTGSGEHASDPVWCGRAHELQLRARRAPQTLRVHFVAVPRSARRRGARAVAAARKARAAQGGPPVIVTREQWEQGRCPPRTGPSYGAVQLAFVHHTVSANDYTPEEAPGMVLGICKYHRDTNGWNDIGYNFLVDMYGQVFEGRAGGIDQAVIGAQAQGYNSHSTGIANLGTFSDVPQTEAALDAMARLIAWKLPLHGVPVEGEVEVVSGGGSSNRHPYGTTARFQRISGHRDGNATSCPGNALYAQLPELRRRAAALAPAIAAAVRVTLDPPADPAVVYGEDLVLTGVLRRADGSPIAGHTVDVLKRGTTRWVRVARTTTREDGGWTARVAWRRAGALRARAAVPGSPVTTSPAVTVGLLPRLEAATAVQRIRAGRTLVVRGRVRPKGPVRVTVDREKNGRFVRVGEVTVRSRSSRFRAVVRLRRAGLYRITPRAGARPEPVAAPALYVRAVRRGRVDIDPASTGGAGAR